MALNPATFSAAMLASTPFPTGPSYPLFVTCLATSLTAWAGTPSNVFLTGVTTGLAGAGTVFGNLLVPPNPQLVSNIFASSGIVGPTAPLLATAIGIGVATGFSTAQYTGASIGVSAGSDVSKVVFVNPATLIPILLGTLPAIGPSSPLIAFAVAQSIAALLLTGVGVGGVVPVTPAPSPSAGVSPFSNLF